MIDLTIKQKAEVMAIIGDIFADEPINVYAFGSRVKGNARQFSDLDLALKTKTPMAAQKKAELAMAFSESNLPFMVDVIDLNIISKKFYQAIENEMQPLID